MKIHKQGFEELRRKIFSMDINDIASLLGIAPTLRDMMKVGFDDLQPVLSRIATQKPDLQEAIRPVPSDKVEANGLSDATEDLIRFGMYRANLVQHFFDRWHNPSFGESIAMAFQHEYQRLQSAGLTPDGIFNELQIFAGGERVPSPVEQCSIYAVLAYLFERCHIYEPSRTDGIA